MSNEQRFLKIKLTTYLIFHTLKYKHLLPFCRELTDTSAAREHNLHFQFETRKSKSRRTRKGSYPIENNALTNRIFTVTSKQWRKVSLKRKYFFFPLCLCTVGGFMLDLQTHFSKLHFLSLVSPETTYLASEQMALLRQ